MGKGENKKPAPATRGESKRPYWHTGGAALGLAGSNKMLSVPPHRRDQDGSAEGGATRLGTIGYRAKADACPGLAALDLKPTWPIYKFCFHWWQAGLPDMGTVWGVAGGNNLFCAAPPLWERARLVGAPSPVKQCLSINFTHVRVEAQALLPADGAQGI